jgi:glycosyltransferase involved in cell wall biosynthesis
MELFEARAGAQLVRRLPDLDWVLYTRGALPPEWSGTRPGEEILCPPRSRIRGGRLFAEQVSWPSRLRSSPVDLLVVLAFSPPFGYRRPYVVMVHDLAPLERPHDVPALMRAYWMQFLRRSAPGAHRLLTPSLWVKQQCAERLGVPPERIDVVHNGVEFEFFSAAASPDAGGPVPPSSAGGAPLSRPFWLHCGTIYPRKNLQVLVRALGLLQGRAQEVPTLVSVGGGGRHRSELVRQARRLGVGEHVRFLGRLPDAALRDLYASCAAFVYPSWIEGFGVPPLEALAAGAPVIAARASCLPEILGDSARWADPAEPESWLVAWDEVRSEDAAVRAARRRAGADWAARYTWEETGTRVAGAVQRAVQSL